MDEEQVGFTEVERAFRDDCGAVSTMRSVERLFGSVSSYAVFCFDPAGVILTWNPGVQSILGFSPEHFVGRQFSELFTDEDRRRGIPQQEMTSAARRGEAHDDRWHVRRDGSHVFVAGVVAPVRDARGDVQGFMKLIRDRTGFLESAARLRRRRDRAEAANREKDTFVAVLAHELRQPLTAIVGWSHLGATGRVPPQRTGDVFDKIRRAADATIHFVNDLLDMSRIGSGKLQLTLQPTMLAAVVRDSVSELASAAEARGLTVSVDANDTCTANADPVRLRQVVTNLVGNAVKYTPRGGSIHVSVHSQDSRAVVSVSDTGLGIAEGDLPVIFERFRQSHAADKKQSGLGLGLWVAKQLVERHGGTIEAYSEGAGKGATFVVRIPCLSPAAKT